MLMFRIFQIQCHEEILKKTTLKMELDSKDSEIQLQIKLAKLNSEIASLSSIDNDGNDFNSKSVFRIDFDIH